VTQPNEEAAADWLILAGGLVLFASLFLTWSHQFSASFLGRFGHSTVLQGVPRNPTAWQVYSTSDVVLALLAGALAGVAVLGSHRARLLACSGAVLALIFVVHAMSAPPTNGALIYNPAAGHYAANSPAAGPGETVAVIGLLLALTGLALSLLADRASPARAPATA